MNYNSDFYSNNLLVVIIDKGKGSSVLKYAKELGIRGATAFHACGTVPGRLLRLLELDERHKEIIMFAIPQKYINDTIQRLTERFHFDRPNKGIIFTLELSGVYGSSHFTQEPIKLPETIDASMFQAVMTIVNKGRTDSILDFIEENGFPRGTVIDAHGSADKSKAIQHLMLEPEKDILLTITTRDQAQRLASMLKDHLNLEAPNSGILAILNINHLVGVTLTLQAGLEDNKSESKVSADGYSAVFAVVNNDKDEEVIHCAQAVGSNGATIIHARGSRPYYGKTFLSHGIEPEREIVMIIAENHKLQAICDNIIKDLSLDKSGNGILMVVPLYDTVGLVSQE